MHDGVQYDPIQGQGQKPFKVGNLTVFNSYFLRHLQWQLATDHRFLNSGTVSKFDRVGFLIFFLVFVSLVFVVGTNVSCEESTVSPRTGLFFKIWYWKADKNASRQHIVVDKEKIRCSERFCDDKFCVFVHESRVLAQFRREMTIMNEGSQGQQTLFLCSQNGHRLLLPGELDQT